MNTSTYFDVNTIRTKIHGKISKTMSRGNRKSQMEQRGNSHLFNGTTKISTKRWFQVTLYSQVFSANSFCYLWQYAKIGAIHTGPRIRILCGSEIWIQRPLCFHTASIRIQAACETTLNPDRGSEISESGFSACVESPITERTIYILPFIIIIL